MNQKNNPIPVEISLQALQTINLIACIAQKAHSNNPSPVDIKLELEAIDPDMLFNIIETTGAIINANQPIKL